MHRFERFCQKNERYGIKNLMLIIAVGETAMGLVFLWLRVASPATFQTISSWLIFTSGSFLQGKVWQLLTFPFSIPWLIRASGFFDFAFGIISMMFYIWAGRTLERYWGRLKLTIFYLTGLLLTAAYTLFPGAIFADPIYINLSLFFAIATLMPDERAFGLIKFKYLALVYLGYLFLEPFINGTYVSWSISSLYLWQSLMPLAAIANYLIYFWRSLRDLLRRAPGRIRSSQRTVQFKREVRRARTDRGYIHKCAVCERTDTDCPDMEFRYCSLCAGYACYCAEHIFNHPHKTV